MPRELAAAIFGMISPTKFDDLVKDGRAPQPCDIDGCVRWDVEELRAAWRALPRRGAPAQDAGSEWDRALAR